MLVLRAGQTRSGPAQRVSVVLDRFRAEVLGVILNGCDDSEMDSYYGYGYGYGEPAGYRRADPAASARELSRGPDSGLAHGDVGPGPMGGGPRAVDRPGAPAGAARPVGVAGAGRRVRPAPTRRAAGGRGRVARPRR